MYTEIRSDISGYLDLEVIDASVDSDVMVRPPVGHFEYRSAAIHRAGARDSFTCAIAHHENDVAVLDRLVEIKARFNPCSATGQIAAVLKSYGLSETVGDRYAAEWVVQSRGWFRTPRSALSRRPLVAQGQGQEPDPSRIRSRKGLVLMTVWVFINTSKRVGDAGHIRVFAKLDAAEKWFEENDPEGVAFEYDVLE